MAPATPHPPATTGAPARFTVRREGAVLCVCFSGDWLLARGVPPAGAFNSAFDQADGAARVVAGAADLGAWDTGLLLAVRALAAGCAARRLELALEELPEGVANLLRLSRAVAPRLDSEPIIPPRPLAAIGLAAGRVWRDAHAALAFFGELAASVGRLACGRRMFRPTDFWLELQACGPRALGIVTLISLLVGAILAFVGAVQLRLFGAEIYIANLVGTGMVIEMGALMTGIVLAGRTGAAFAAQLGTMQVNEEIDALRTLGIAPVDYLVLPRVLALALMTPLLVVYADLLGILGGALVSLFVLDVAPAIFFARAADSISPWFCMQGVIKGSTFGVLVALIGCFQGMRCGRNAAAVGEAATSAVVGGIVAIVLADALWTYAFLIIG